MSTNDMPPVTDAHRLAAFKAMQWQGMSYEQAMASDTHRRIVEARAALLRKREWQTRNTRIKPRT